MSKKSRWRIIYRYLSRSSKNPESLARGVGLGLFIGFLPAIGFQIILAILLAGFLNANKLVAVLGTLVTNPITAIPIGAFSLWLGDWILPGTNLSGFSIESFKWSELLDSSSKLGVSYLFGCLILSVSSSLIGYGAVKIYFYRNSSWLNGPKS